MEDNANDNSNTPASVNPHLPSFPSQNAHPISNTASAPPPSFLAQRLPYRGILPAQTQMVLVPASSFASGASSAAMTHVLAQDVPRMAQDVPRMAHPNAPAKQKKNKTSSRRKLSHEENLVIIDFWKENYDDFMKSNKKEFASRGVQKLNRDATFQDPDKPLLSAAQLESTIKYWMKRYKEVSDQFKNSGFGLTEDDPDSLKAVGAKKFKYFWELHEFLSCRANVNPPFLLQPRAERGNTVIDIAKFRTSAGSGVGQVVIEDGDEEDDEDEELLDMVQPENREASGNKSRQLRASGSRRQSRGSSHSGRRREKNTEEPSTKKRRVSSGAALLSDTKANQGREQSVGKSNGPSEKEGKNSAGRTKLVGDMLASQLNSTEEQNDSYAKTVAAIERETEIRSKEVTIMEKNAFVRVKESEILEREQARKDREEERVQKEEMRKDQEERRKEREAKRNEIMAKRKMIMEEAEQLRKQADMYMKLDLKEEAVKAMKQSEELVEKLRDIVDENE